MKDGRATSRNCFTGNNQRSTINFKLRPFGVSCFFFIESNGSSTTNCVSSSVEVFKFLPRISLNSAVGFVRASRGVLRSTRTVANFLNELHSIMNRTASCNRSRPRSLTHWRLCNSGASLFICFATRRTNAHRFRSSLYYNSLGCELFLLLVFIGQKLFIAIAPL